MSLVSETTTSAITAVESVPAVIRLDSPPPAQKQSPVVICLDSPPPAEKESTVSSPPAPEALPQAPVAVTNVLKRPLPLLNNLPPKMVIHVPKSLYKAYKEGKFTLAQLMEKAKKVNKASQ
jgi:hypothetical protein